MHGSGVTAHQGERLFRTLFSLSKAADRILAVGICGQMKPAEALDGQDVSPFEQGDPLCDRIGYLNLLFIPTEESHRWAAGEAGVRLSMEASVQGVIVFIPALWAHGEVLHCGAVAIIGNAFHDRVTRATVRTVDEGVAMTPIRGVKQFGQAFAANTDIRADEGRIAALISTLRNGELLVVPHDFGMNGDFGDPSHRRELPGEPTTK